MATLASDDEENESNEEAEFIAVNDIFSQNLVYTYLRCLTMSQVQFQYVEFT